MDSISLPSAAKFINIPQRHHYHNRSQQTPKNRNRVILVSWVRLIIYKRLRSTYSTFLGSPTLQWEQVAGTRVPFFTSKSPPITSIQTTPYHFFCKKNKSFDVNSNSPISTNSILKKLSFHFSSNVKQPKIKKLKVNFF